MEKQTNIPPLRFPEFTGDWGKKKLEIIGDYIGGGTPNTSVQEYWEGNIPWISSSDIIEKDIHNINIQKYITEEAVKNSATKKIPSNSLLIVSRVGVGKFAINKSTVCTSQDFTNIVIDTKVFDANFSAFNLYKNIDILHNISQGTSIKGFTIVDLKKTELSFPTLPEQTKIASFLTAIDEKIQALKKKHSLLEQYKKGVMQKLFSQETEERGSQTQIKNNKKSLQLRFKDENGNDFPEWEEKKLSDILIEVVEKTESSNQYKILSSTAKGLFYQDKYFTRDIASKDNSGYKILRKGQLVFSPQNLWLGNINVNTEFEVGIVSPSYKVFSFNEKFTNADFCQYFLLTPKILFEYEQSSVQGASVVRRNLDMDRFLNIAISMPSLKEQKAISNLISSITNKLKTLEKQVRMTEDWKKGLLQKMFV